MTNSSLGRNREIPEPGEGFVFSDPKDEETRCFYALNGAVTSENYEAFLDATAPNPLFNNQLEEADAPVKKVWLDIFKT